MSGPVEFKVTAAAIASALTGLTLWVLQTHLFHDAVPLPVLAVVQTVIPALVTFFAGYLVPHTPRPDLVAGAHALDGDPGEVSVRDFRNPGATRYDGPGNIQQ